MPLDHDAMKELELFIDNDGRLYETMTVPIEKNLYRKMVAGTYSKVRAPAAWAHLIEAGAKKYAKEIGGGAWSTTFPKPERDALAVEYARHFEGEVERGFRRHLERDLPKKRNR